VNFCFVILNVAAAMHGLMLGFLFFLAILLAPLVSIADGRVLHQLGYNASRKKCFQDSLKMNLLTLMAAFLLLFITQEVHRFAIRNWNANTDALKLLILGLLLPFLLLWLFTAMEVRLIQFMNPAFPRPLIRKSMLLRYGLKALYLLVFIVGIAWLDYQD
jgi:hypothetical protein